MKGKNGGQYVEFRRLEQVFKHPTYGEGGPTNKDFALLKLKSPSTITPVPMDSQGLSKTYSSGKAPVCEEYAGRYLQYCIIL